MQRVRISIFVLLIALWIPASSVFAARCDSNCPDDEASEQCLPGCHECACCPAVRIAVTQVALPAPIPRVARILPRALPPPAAPDPAEIAHVPKRIAA